MLIKFSCNCFILTLTLTLILILNIPKCLENVPTLEIVEVVLVLCNLVKNDYHHTSKVLFTFVPNKKLDN